MNREDVAELLGPTIKGKTVSTYLYESQVKVGRGPRERAGRYVKHPFPAPDGYHGKAPWWRLERADEILMWRDSRPGRGAGGGRPRQSG
ncbi:hypothetical protein ACWKSP_22125 [Micromonosporaceae bacterium Da 78-11]